MGTPTFWQRLPLQTVLIAVTIGLCSAQECWDKHWNPEPQYCDEGSTEIYRDQDRTSKQWMARCCTPGTPSEENELIYRSGCETTGCVPKEYLNLDLCTTLYFERYVDGKKLNYEETIRADCDANGGGEAVCCPSDSTEVLLTTLLQAEHKEFPHFARLGSAGCGGTLYNKKWVLTASHCVVDSTSHKPYAPGSSGWDDNAGKVRFNIDVKSAFTKDEYKVKRIVVHPESSLLKPLDKYNRIYYDVALLELESEVQYNENVKPLKIVKKGFKPTDYSDNVVIVGFGTTDTLRLSQKLQKANLLIRDNDFVFGRTGPLWFMSDYKDQLLPVGGIVNGSVSSAVGKGDSGGPAICKDENNDAILCGVTSFAGPLANCTKYLNETYCIPSVYAAVEYFHDWIVEIAGEQTEDDLLQRKLYGYPADENSYLNQVHVTADGTKPCGGTIIAENLVLTAAHCVAEDNGDLRSGVFVTSGVRDLADTSMAKQDEVVAVELMDGFKRISKAGDNSNKSRRKRVVSLPLEAWRQKKANTPKIMADPYYENDLAILKLKGNAIGHPAKLASPSEPNSTAHEVSFPRQAKFGQALSVRNMKILSDDDCQKRLDRLSKLGYNIKLNENLVCGVEMYSGGSLCDRELGGGLFCSNAEGEEVLCGVQVFRLCQFNIPNAFMDMGKALEWVEQAKKAMAT